MSIEQIDQEIKDKESEIQRIRGAKNFRQWDLYQPNMERIRELNEDLQGLYEKRLEAVRGRDLTRALKS